MGIRRGGGRTALVIVDGLDGAGKDTVAGILATLLAARDRTVAVRSHPSGNVFGRMAKAFLLSRGLLARAAATFFFGLDALTSTAFLGYLRRRNDVVIFVRYLLSAAYLPRSMSRPIHDWFASFLPDADVKLYVSTRPDVAMARIEERDESREMFETPDAFERVRHRVAALMDESWTVIDNNGSFRAIREQLEPVLLRITSGGGPGRRASGGGSA